MKTVHQRKLERELDNLLTKRDKMDSEIKSLQAEIDVIATYAKNGVLLEEALKVIRVVNLNKIK